MHVIQFDFYAPFFIPVAGFSIKKFMITYKCLADDIKDCVTVLPVVRIIYQFCPVVPSNAGLDAGAGRGFVKGR